MNFGEKLRHLRKEKHLSQKEVADKLNISLRTYSYYETNKRQPRTKAKLEELAAFFGKPVEYLLIDNIKDKLEYLEKTSFEEFSTLEGYKYIDNIFDNISQFLSYFGWEIHEKNPERPSQMVATLDSKRIIFEVSSPLPSFSLIYGYLCTLPKEQYKETHCVIIAEKYYTDFSVEDIFNNNPPINLTIPVKFYYFNADTNKFESKEIYDYIYEIGHNK